MTEDQSPLSRDASPEVLSQALLDAAEQHGLATEGADMAWGDVEEFFRAAFDLLTPEQRDRFWDDDRVLNIVQDGPEYEAIAAAVYGAQQEENGEEAQEGSPD